MKKFFSAIGGIIGYLASLSLAVFFALYCSGRVGWFLVLTFVLAPILSALFTFLFQKNIFLTCDFEKPLCAKGETCDIVIHVKNRLFLPTPSVRIEIKDSPRLVSPDKIYSLSVMPFSEVSFTVPLSAGICGVSEIGIQSMKIRDYLYLFTRSAKTGPLPLSEVCVVPDIAWVSAEEDYIRETVTASMECGESEETVDSASFIFGGFPGYDHREYIPGDPLKRMNWKLSAKRDKLLVRLDEEAATTSVAVVLDSLFTVEDGDLMNMESGLYEYGSRDELLAKIAENAVETALGISRVLLSRNLSVTFFYKSKDGFVSHHLHNEDYFPPLVQELAHFSFDTVPDTDRFPEEILSPDAATLICTPNRYDTLDLSGLVIYSALDRKGRTL